jgi:hypothetical protein
MVNILYRDREIIVWPDGTAINSGLRDMLYGGIQPGFEIQHGEFKWNADNTLTMTFRLAVMRGRSPRNWEIKFSCAAEAAAAIRQESTYAEREWFTMMVRTRIAEWLGGSPSIIESARLVK